MEMERPRHRFRFLRIGGFDQVILEHGADLAALEELDQKLWGALSCPAQGLEFPERTLELIDADDDDRIRAPEILASVRWALDRLADPDELVRGGDVLSLEAIATDRPEGEAIMASARQILEGLGKSDAKEIGLDDVRDLSAIYAHLKFNGDGVIPASSTDEPAVAKAIEDILSCVGGEEDRSGAQGITTTKLKLFYKEAAAFDGWRAKAEKAPETIAPLGEKTDAAVSLFFSLSEKVDDWFTRCNLAAFDPRAAAPLNRAEDEFAAISGKLLSAGGEEVASFPLARVEAGAALPLETGLNPAWAERVAKLRDEVVIPLLGERSSLSAEDWSELKGRLAAAKEWADSKPEGSVEKLGTQRLRELLVPEIRQAIEELIRKDEALEPEVTGIASVERLIRYKRDLYGLLRNFVSFTDFYAKRKAIFQAGTLYLDGRSCDLTVQVADAAAHAAIASASNVFLAYCECVRKSDGKKMTIAAAFTDGESDRLAVGRNGIFYDRKGADWDATIIKLVEHPISIRQAFWLPYRRIGKLIGDQIDRMAAARDQRLQEQAAANLEGAAATAGEKADGKAQAFDVARFAGIFAAIGLAIGAIGSTIAAVATGFLGLAWWKMPLAVLGIILLISVPSMILAWLKLRRRSLGPILDAAGWAVNTQARINIPFGSSLTAVATLPKGSIRSMRDPFAPKRGPRIAWAAALAVAAFAAITWWTGHLPRWIGVESEPQAAASVEEGAASDEEATAAEAEGSAEAEAP